MSALAGVVKSPEPASRLMVFAVHMLVIFLYPLTGVLYGGGLTYSQTDYSIFWMPVFAILSGIGHALGLA